MIDFNSSYEMIALRQADLRALAKRHPAGQRSESGRQRIGRLVQHIGRWIEGGQPETPPGPFVTERWRFVPDQDAWPCVRKERFPS